MERLVDNNYNKLLEKDEQKKIKKCNYRIKDPLDGNCLIKDIVYKAKITNKDEIKYYIGVAKGD